MGHQYALVAKKVASIATRPGDMSLPCSQHCRVQSWAPCYWSSPVSTAEMVKGLEHLQFEETRRDGIVQPGGGFMKILLMCTDPWLEKV